METLHIMTNSGEILYKMLYRPTSRLDIPELFDEYVRYATVDAAVMPPVVTIPDHQITLCYCTTRHLTWLASVSSNASALSILAFLRAVEQVLTELFDVSVLKPDHIRAKLLTVNEIMDELVDGGMPLTTDILYLRDVLALKAMKSRAVTAAAQTVTMQATGLVRHRKEGITYSRNMVWLDVVESVSAVISAQGVPTRVDVQGEVKMRAELSGMPECHCAFNRRGAGAVASGDSTQGNEGKLALDNVSFNKCVRLSQFEDDRTLSFIPPDGESSLMRYRVGGAGALTSAVRLPFHVLSLTKRDGREVTVNLSISCTLQEGNCSAPYLIVRIPLPPGTTSVTCEGVPRSGSGRTDIGANQYVVRMRDLLPGDTIKLRMHAKTEGEAVRQGGAASGTTSSGHVDGYGAANPEIQMEFQVQGMSVSGIKILFFNVLERRLGYKAERLIRYETNSNDYTIRM